MAARVALFGLGRMGAGYASAGGKPRNHLAAIMATPGLELVAAIDPSHESRAAAARTYPEMAARIGAGPELDTGRAIDLAVISTPTQVRESAVAAALEPSPRLIVVEKPLASTLAEGQRIANAARARGTRLRVNFHRRLAPEMVALRAASPGTVRGVQARYGKGLLNYGSHLIDLLIQWCGRPTEAQALGEPAGAAADPTISFRLRFASGAEALVLGIEGTRYDVFDVSLLHDDGMTEIRAGGAERSVWSSQMDRHYPGYAHLAPRPGAASEGPLSGLAELYAAAAAHLLDGRPMPGCDAADALAGLEVVEAIRRSAALGGANVPLLLAFDENPTDHSLERLSS